MTVRKHRVQGVTNYPVRFRKMNLYRQGPGPSERNCIYSWPPFYRNLSWNLSLTHRISAFPRRPTGLLLSHSLPALHHPRGKNSRSLGAATVICSLPPSGGITRLVPPPSPSRDAFFVFSSPHHPIPSIARDIQRGLKESFLSFTAQVHLPFSIPCDTWAATG